LLQKVLVATRGEIAVRVVRACRELGIGCAVVHSDADALAMAVRVADESVRLPGRRPAETYLSATAIISAAREVGADAIHPGYGFLSENPEFAAAVERAGISLIGPPASAIAALADKVRAREIAAGAGLPGPWSSRPAGAGEAAGCGSSLIPARPRKRWTRRGPRPWPQPGTTPSTPRST
jgi:acetyl/propionyl-CoA carboxylase alpha subunit